MNAAERDLCPIHLTVISRRPTWWPMRRLGCKFLITEMIRAGLGHKTGARMGHLSISGPGGTIAALAGLNIGRRVFVHMNNTNPVLRPGSAERAEAEAAGWTIGQDGLEITP